MSNPDRTDSPLHDALPPSLLLEEGCIEGTRQNIFATIQKWLISPELTSSKVLWLADISGSGKSAVARHIACTYQDQVLCSFFFKRDVLSQASTSKVIDGLSYELQQLGEPIASEIAQGYKNARGAGYTEAFHTRITAPLCHHPPKQPSLILIDALDESGLPSERAEFLSALTHEIPLLPPSVKVIITSKPTQDIDDAFNSLSSASSDEDEDLEVYRLTFDVYGQDNRRDLRRYITYTFERVAQLKREEGISLPESWPSDQQRRSLVAHANGLFLWVTVAANYVFYASDPQQALDQLLALQNRPSPEAAIDALYRHVLQTAEENPDFNLPTYHDVLEFVFSSPNPITIADINQILRRDADRTISCLRPVLSAEPALRVVHPSFREYVRDPQKCETRFWITSGSPSVSPIGPSGSLSRAPTRRNTAENTVYVGFPLPRLAVVASYPDTPDLAPDVSEHIVESSIASNPEARGGFGDIWRARYDDGRHIAIKSLRFYGPSAHTERRKFERNLFNELAVWSRLKHRNVLDLIGICVFGGEISMVCEWMPNGNVMEYTRIHPEVDKLKLITDIADGLAYLHSHQNKIVHGDLKGGNVVVSADGTARLVDFGLARITEDTLGFSTTAGTAGTTRWMARELVVEESRPTPTFASDVYALGMTILEILTGQPPFLHLKNDVQVVAALLRDERPDRPTTASAPQLSDQVWGLITRCWSSDTESRPSANAVHKIMMELSHESQIGLHSSGSNWGSSASEAGWH